MVGGEDNCHIAALLVGGEDTAHGRGSGCEQ